MNWFTTETISDDTFVISEYRHYENTHCYLLVGKERALLIDTGLGVENIRPAAERLTDRPITAVITHAHWDHIGSLADFSERAVFSAEAAWVNGSFPLPPAVVRAQLVKGDNDFPADFCADRYAARPCAPTRLLADGDRFDLGGRSATVIHTPGHSPGHICLFEPDRGWLYTGDLIYSGCLFANYPTTDPAAFFDSVKRVGRLDLKRIFPAHHSLDVAPSLVGKIAGGFAEIEAKGLLRQGSGMFTFKNFEILI